jgi:Fe-S cluster assembly protein SufD
MARKQIQKGLPFTSEMIQAEQGTPAVLQEYRNAAWEDYQKIPLPTIQDEAWRRTALTGFDFQALDLANGKADPEEMSQLSRSLISKDILEDFPHIILSSAGVKVFQAEKLKDQGVVFSSLNDAAQHHPQLVEKVLGKVVSPQEGKFAAAVGAFSRDGIFIYVPKGVILDDPLFGLISSPGKGTAHFFQTLICVEEGASLNYFQETSSVGDQSAPSLAGENLEILIGPNANLQVTELQNFGREVWSFGHKKALVEQDGNLKWEIGALGSRLSKHFVSLDLVGKGAEGRVSGLFFADGDQHISYNTLQRHLAPRTTSDLLFKGALNGESRSVWRGMIYVAEGARHIDGYQANRNLVLDPATRTDSIPGLEILNDDVRCTHGSTIGKIDEEQLFYLLSRGLPRVEAERLVIQGFFDDILSMYSIPAVSENLWEKISDRLTIEP